MNKPIQSIAEDLKGVEVACRDALSVLREQEDLIAKLTAERDAARAEAQEWLTEASAWKKQAIENHTAEDLAKAQVQELAEWKVWAENEMHRMIEREKALSDRCSELYNQLHGLPPVTEPTIAAGTGPVEAPAPDVVAPGDLRGLQAKVSEHSRQIGALQDECSKLRDRLAKVEARSGRVLEDA